MKKLRVCVIGLGYFSQFHLQAWDKTETTEIVGVCDPSEDRREWAATNFDVTTYASLQNMLADCDPDIIDIVAPPPAHAELVRACLKSGRVLVCQKPFCQNLSEAEAVAAEAETQNTPVIIHENFRFQPWYRAVKSFLEAGKMGQIFRAHFALRPGDGRGSNAYLDRQPAFQTMPRLMIHETGVHFIDLFRWLLGPIEAVYADLRKLNPVLKGEDAGILVMNHTSGAQSILDGNRLSDHATAALRLTMGEFELEGERGALRVDGYGKVRFRNFGEQTWRDVEIKNPVDETSFGGGCVEALCKHVADAFQTDGAYENLARDYLHVLRAEQAAYASNDSASKIKITQV